MADQQTLNDQNSSQDHLIEGNPYVGPRTFRRAEQDRHFGREREARDLLSLVISQRLVLFYSQSGAGKSSLVNTQLVPQLNENGFLTLPVGRVGGDLPEGIREVDNIYLYSLISSLDQGDNDPNRFARISLTHFLQQLTTDDGETWYYEAPDSAVTSDLAVEQRQTTAEAEDSLLSSGFEAEIEPDKEAPFDFSSGDAEHVSVTTPYVLIIDQFEELITNHPERWSERAGFFEQLEAAMQADPALWVLLVLREDYVAALDPYAPIMADKLRARYYMERMGVDAALRAIRQPAALGRRPFAPGVAEQLVDNLLRIVVSAETGETKLGQYVEPVQLQVVCYQLWEELEDVERTRGQDEGMISGTESSPHPSTSSSSQTQ